ncbi:MAG: hypothetical protein SFY92_07670, partial [Verrucomicrobiae bacterium]|nr:hypothetical protein [Verrucomicrobiae bacterium]
YRTDLMVLKALDYFLGEIPFHQIYYDGYADESLIRVLLTHKPKRLHLRDHWDRFERSKAYTADSLGLPVSMAEALPEWLYGVHFHVEGHPREIDLYIRDLQWHRPDEVSFYDPSHMILVADALEWGLDDRYAWRNLGKIAIGTKRPDS